MKKGKEIFIIGWLLASVAYGQETKEVTEQNNVYAEKYTVLKANKRTKHGPYEQFFRETLIEKGEYSHGQRVGLWEFYDLKGILDQKFDYTSKQMQYSASYNLPDSLQTIYTIINGTDTTYARLARPPVPLGGKSHLSRLLMLNIRYPVSAQRSGKQGVVYVSYLVDETGKFGSVRVVRSSGDQSMDAEAIRVINLYNTLQWIPAELDGRKVSTVSNQPVRFNNIGVINGPR